MLIAALLTSQKVEAKQRLRTDERLRKCDPPCDGILFNNNNEDLTRLQHG